ncbi:hypothetical protein LINGRAHAP2_LOCUS7645 [Linum grandiflorum]
MWSADEEQRRWRLSWVTRKLLLSGSTPGATTAAIGRTVASRARWRRCTSSAVLKGLDF